MKNNKPSIKDFIRSKVNDAGDRIELFFNPVTKSIQKIFAVPMRNKYFAGAISHVQKWSMYYILIFIFVFFVGFTNGNLLQPNQIILLIRNNVHIIILALPMTLVIISGNIDLSVGSILGFFGFASVIIYNNTGNSLVFTILLTMLAGLALGMAHGVLIGYFKIPAFIITLGSMLIFAGARSAITSGQSLVPEGGSVSSSYITGIIGTVPDVNINGFWIGAFIILISVSSILLAIRIFSFFKKWKLNIHTDKMIIFWIKTALYAMFGIGFSLYIALSFEGLTFYSLISIVTVLFFIFISKFTTYGRAVYSIGGNRKAAELSGIDPRKTNFITFSLMGMVIALASIVFTGITNNATATSGIGFELQAISSVFIGGASVWGGIGTITGTLIGTFVLQIIDSGMQINSVPASIQNIVKGIILILAVGYDVYSHRKIK